MDGFRHVYPINVRFKDIDALGHVNNAVVFTYIETARVPYIAALGIRSTELSINDISFIVAHINCDFRRPIFYGQKVEVGTRVTNAGRSSMRLEHRIEADGNLAAEGYCILVHYDYRSDRSIPLSAEVLAKIEAFEGRKVTKNS
jgi:acyl-CoA thioester hydrolase